MPAPSIAARAKYLPSLYFRTTSIDSRTSENASAFLQPLIAGGDQKSNEKILAKIKSRKNSDQISLVERLPQIELRQLLQRADLAIIPNSDRDEISKYSSPLKLFEYLAVGLPIVASEVLRDHGIIKEQVNCLFFKPGDKLDLASKIESLLDNDILRETLSRNNRQIAPEFSYDERASSIIEAMSKIQV